jgi:hypothetical protein
MNTSAEIHAKKYFNVSKELFPSIIDEFAEIEEGEKIDIVKSERLSDKIKRTLLLLKQIDTGIISEMTDNDTIETIEDNINYMYEELIYVKNRLLANKYIENLRSPVKNYIARTQGDPSNYKKWAKNEEDLVGKFIGMLTHPNNIELYLNYIKRMAVGTMSDAQFKKMFNATKHKMIPDFSQNNFQSFSDFKNKND